MLLEAKWATAVSKAFCVIDTLSNANNEAGVNTIITVIAAPGINSGVHWSCLSVQFSHVSDSLEKSLMLGKIEGRRRRGNRG